MSNLDNLIEWMEKEGKKLFKKLPSTSEDYFFKKGMLKVYDEYLTKAKQLQKEEPKTYTQEQYDKGCNESYQEGLYESQR